MENNFKTPSNRESLIIKIMIFMGIFSVLNFLFYFFQPEYRGNAFLFLLLTVTILYSSLKKLYLWYNYSNISIPTPPESTSEFSVDILTTYFPGEPYQMIITTLEAINNIDYPHNTYLCDEANDPYLKKFCEENEIHHITRNNWKDAKAGNINNALQKAASGDICVILDPDHIPEPNFLDPILPYFEDPRIGFVQIVQSYYNNKETLVSQGAAEQTFQFYGPMMMTLNAYGAVNAIGANCVFRRKALDSIGGHAPGLCEDMHTAMLLYSKAWKGVYVPKVLAKGLAPSNLTNFFKQQLKWSRGTFDLLIKVYPKIFKKLTVRQKIHFGILPLHFLAGLICLINFLIPIISLLFSITPWHGEIIDFALVLLPVIFSSLLIRTYIQKWVIDKKERGFHIIGGLLHINTWWVYLLALFYTIRGKKVPYLPTPKYEEWNTNLKLILPNAIVAIISIIAIIYGLQQDLTPYSIIMACFAFFNACIMMFGIYLAVRLTNQNKFLRSLLGDQQISNWRTIKHFFNKVANFTFVNVRIIALFLLLIVIITSLRFRNMNELSKWENVQVPLPSEITTNRLFGIFQPDADVGLSNIQEINAIEKRKEINFDIISFYIAWNDESIKKFPHLLMTSIYEKNALPLITWEPWLDESLMQSTGKGLYKNDEIFHYIAQGYFDDYIKDFAGILDSYERPVFLRFAHEFDNPQYPWYQNDKNAPEEYKAAWKHVWKLFKAEGATNVIFVWNPWKAETMAEYYPGDKYVDWIGITLLNYGPFNSDGKYYSFGELYEPFKNKLYWFTNKPVMLAEFGSLNLYGRQEEWLKDAMHSIKSNFNEISAVVMFNSRYDKNIPVNAIYEKKYLDWSTNSLKKLSTYFEHEPINRTVLLEKSNGALPFNPITQYNIKGVRYKKGKTWKNNYYVLTKNVLQKDFSRMKNAGINTVQFIGGNIYDHNLLLYTQKFDLNVIYQFDINNSIDFIHDQEELDELKEDILNQVKDLIDNKNVIGYAFRLNLDRFYGKPLLFYQKTAYLNWLDNLAGEIKNIDASKSLVIDMELDATSLYNIQRIENHLPIDSYGLRVKDTTYLKEVIRYSEENNISIYLSEIQPEMLMDGNPKVENLDVVLENWQDERKSNWLTFDGLIDFEGNKKRILGRIKNLWSEDKVSFDNKTVDIIKPAAPLYPGTKYPYYAVLFANNEWVLASESSKDFSFSWYLVKKGQYGHPLAVKEIGEGNKIMVEIPQQYKHYQILVIAKNEANDYVLQSRSSLNTGINVDYQLEEDD